MESDAGGIMDLRPVDRARLEAACEACRHLHARGLLVAGDGNLSLRLGDGRFAITPSGANKARIRPEDWALLAWDGQVLHGQPSSERPMHLATYRACSEAAAVVHAHPPAAIAWTLAFPRHGEIPADALPEVILAAGRIPVVPYARPGTDALADSLKPFLPAHRLLALARHGALAWGESLEEAVDGIERLEHVCHILAQARLLGWVQPLPEAEIRALKALRQRRGSRLF